MPVRRTITNYFKAMMPLTPFRETEQKIYFHKRCSPAPAAPGNTKSPDYIEAILLSGCGAGWGAWPGNPSLGLGLLAAWQYGSECGNFTHIY